MAERLGEYRLLDEIGRGSTAIVRYAVDSRGREVAVKLLRPEYAADPISRRRLAREIAAHGKVRSPHVARLLDGDVRCDRPHAVLQYVPGPTLRGLVGAYGPLRGPALLDLASRVAQGLADIHQAGVVHRDMTPGNIIVLGGAPVIIDFGIAHEAGASQITRPGVIMGTPAYLAPELIESGGRATAASDVFSFAASMAYAGTGRPPFGTGTLHGVCYRILRGDVDLEGLPGLLASLVRRALVRDPDERPAARWFADALAPYCTVSTGPAGPADPADPADPAASRGESPGSSSALAGRDVS